MTEDLLTRKEPMDYNQWEVLISQLEKMKTDRESLIASLKKFLLEYPLGYFYWKKLVELYRKSRETEQAERVREQKIIF